MPPRTPPPAAPPTPRPPSPPPSPPCTTLSPTDTLLSFGAGTTVKQSNLDGADASLPATLLYGNVGLDGVTGRSLDLEVT
eukprot:1620734-Prymnesium_polylepis.1